MTQLARIGMGLIGPGFIAPHHIDAVRRLGYVDVVAIAGSSAASAEKKAREYGVGRSYGDYRELIADPDVHVVHNTTPSHLHFPVSMAALEAGKHVISDKPLAIDPEQCRKLRDAAAAAGVVNAVTFNYRGNPLVQQARAMIAAEDIGRVVFIHGHYLQDWMTSDKVYSWRSDPVKGYRLALVRSGGAHLRAEDHGGARGPDHGGEDALLGRWLGGGVRGRKRWRTDAGRGDERGSGERAAALR
jgi:predicted dehydrogenase